MDLEEKVTGVMTALGGEVKDTSDGRQYPQNMNITKSEYYKPEYIQKIVHEIKNPLKPVMVKLLDPALDAVSKAKALYEIRKILKKVRELPKPTKANTKRYNTHQLIEVRDYIFSHIKNIPFAKEMEEFADLIIIVIDTDFYSPFIVELLQEIKKRDWQPNGPLQPDPHFWDKKD